MSCKDVSYDPDGFCYMLHCDENVFTCYCSLRDKILVTISDKGCLRTTEEEATAHLKKVWNNKEV